MKIMSVKDLENIRQEHSKRLYWPDAVKVNIGMASCGIAAGAQASYDMAKEVFPAGTGVQICQTGCIGFCEEEPLVEILGYGKPRVMYKHITEKKIADAIKGYMEGDFNKKWILGQMQDPRNVLEEDIDNALAGLAPSRSTTWIIFAPQDSHLRAMAVGSSEKTVSASMRPWRSLTHLPPFKSIAGIIITV